MTALMWSNPSFNVKPPDIRLCNVWRGDAHNFRNVIRALRLSTEIQTSSKGQEMDGESRQVQFSLSKAEHDTAVNANRLVNTSEKCLDGSQGTMTAGMLLYLQHMQKLTYAAASNYHVTMQQDLKKPLVHHWHKLSAVVYTQIQQHTYSLKTLERESGRVGLISNYQCNRASGLCFWRDMANAESMTASWESAVGDEGTLLS